MNDDTSDRIVVSADVLREAGVAPGEDVVVQARDGEVRIVRDAVRKVYVEITSRCNLDCPMCMRHGWEERVGHMPPERFAHLLDGVAPNHGEPVTVAFGGFGE